jgi:D-alanine-D-alanine ligase
VRVAIVYNRDSQNVINLFGRPNMEKIGLKQIARMTDALKQGGHKVTAFEADKDLVPRLEAFMPRVVKGERPGMVFNLSYGLQGQARYTHVPSILEMIGIPYVASGPLAHSLALDKVVTKMILVQHGLPTPEFAVLDSRDDPLPELPYPLIVKPKNEAVSFGIQVVRSDDKLRQAAGMIFDRFDQPVLVERYIDGREVNVGLLGNSPPDALPPVELVFGEGEKVYSYQDKTGKSGREVKLVCPAPLQPKLLERAQTIAKKAFSALGCFDCARVDMRLDDHENLYILEINSLPSLGPRGSYVRAAAEAGLDYPALVNRLVEVASARYFGTPTPAHIPSEVSEPSQSVFSYITEQRDQMENRLREWCRRSSRTNDPVGLDAMAHEVDRLMESLRLQTVDDLSNERNVRTWQTPAGLHDGTLLVAHVDVPFDRETVMQSFRLEPEWLHGEGIGSSRSSLVIIEFALRALRRLRLLRKRRIGVLLYRDEGRDARYSRDLLREAMGRAAQVIVLRPGGTDGCVFDQRRGQRKFRLTVEGKPDRTGKASNRPKVLVWLGSRLEAIHALSSRKQRMSVSFANLKTESYPMLLPHRLEASLLITYSDPQDAVDAEAQVRDILGSGGPRWKLDQVSDRPPLQKRRSNRQLAARLGDVAKHWDLEWKVDSSVWPSVAGLAPESTAVLCGFGPVTRDLQTPNEAVQRLSLVQRTLLLGEFLLEEQGDAR